MGFFSNKKKEKEAQQAALYEANLAWLRAVAGEDASFDDDKKPAVTSETAVAQTPVVETAVAQTPVVETAVVQTPAESVAEKVSEVLTSEEISVSASVAGKTSLEETASKEANPAESVPAETAPAESAPVKSDLAESTPAELVTERDIASVTEEGSEVSTSADGIAEASVNEETIPEAATGDEADQPVYQEKKSFFTRLKEGLTKTRDNILNGLNSVFAGHAKIDEDFYEELEEILIMGDIGVKATTEILDRLRDEVKTRHLKEPEQCRQILIDSIREQMRVEEAAYEFENQQSVVMVIGVNGVGKTTSIGKLAGKLKNQNRKVLIAAADTFRAAASDQLAEWARRADVPMVSSVEGADPASVVFDAVSAAKARNVDVLLVDTAGRLHNKKNLMEELRKMNKIIDKEYPNAHRENLIVLDGTTGQNALVQAREFGDVTNLTGIILTKMDGTAKGGIAVAIQSELKIPVKYIGVGESIDDLQKFNTDDFVNALFDVDLSE